MYNICTMWTKVGEYVIDTHIPYILKDDINIFKNGEKS